MNFESIKTTTLPKSQKSKQASEQTLTIEDLNQNK